MAERSGGLQTPLKAHHFTPLQAVHIFIEYFSNIHLHTAHLPTMSFPIVSVLEVFAAKT
jgi:hypothetical protein